ncbi:MAG: hypothetical protein QNK37_21915 [Acidobacteriota bacterium]|nr:hypothetical protein [Acidobacteriota bacterium]
MTFLLFFLAFNSDSFTPLDPSSFSEPEPILEAVRSLGRENRNETELASKLTRLENMDRLVKRLKQILVERVSADAMSASKAAVQLETGYFLMARYLTDAGETRAAERCYDFAEPLYRGTSLEPNRMFSKAMIIAKKEPERAVAAIEAFFDAQPPYMGSLYRGKFEHSLQYYLSELQDRAGMEKPCLDTLEAYLAYARKNPELISRRDQKALARFDRLTSRYRGSISDKERKEIRKMVKDHARQENDGRHDRRRTEFRRSYEVQSEDDARVMGHNFLARYIH